MLLLLFCFALAYAIQGAAAQAWADGRAGASTAATRGREVYTAKRAQVRESGSPAAKAAFGFGGVLGGIAQGAWWVGKGTGKAVWTGGRDGWDRGRRRGVRVAMRRRVKARCRKAERQRNRPDRTGEPRWVHFFTGRCPDCDHTPSEASIEIAGCTCTNRIWGCPCGLRNTAFPPKPDRDPEPLAEPPTPPEPPVSLIKPPSGGDGTAASDDPDRPEPRDPTPEIADQIDLKENPMPVTGEATDLQSALNQIEQIHAEATTHLDTAAAATQEADEISAAAERLGATLGTAQMDEASQGAVARLREQVAAQAAHAQEGAAIADRVAAAAREATGAISEWLPVAERMRALGAAPDSQFVAGPMSQAQQPAAAVA